uniref:Secreted protein n=1 Tax=Arundo donax TaxID=35708 RepID=A0A0A8ZW36_ARUDO
MLFSVFLLFSFSFTSSIAKQRQGMRHAQVDSCKSATTVQTPSGFHDLGLAFTALEFVWSAQQDVSLRYMAKRTS